MNTHPETPAHPLTEGHAWDIYSDAHPVDAIRAAFDAGRKYERAATKENLARLRDTPAGRALMAEAWEEGALHQARGSAETRRVLASTLPNPYRTAS